MFKKIRIAILLFLLFLVGANAYLTQLRITDWDQSLVVVIYPINGDGSTVSVNYIKSLKLGTFKPIEKFLQAELGIRGESGSWEWQTSYYYTWIKDMIVRSPIESGKSDVLKSNGDGFIQGMEFELGYQWMPSWKSELSFSWMDGEVEQMLDNNATGTVTINGRNYSPVNRATTRLMPVQAKFTTQYAPMGSNWSSTLSFLAVSKANDLSLKDETDITRIPGEGTPGYFLTNFYGNYDISESSSISLAMENIGDVDYRVHGSGLNGAGRNIILSCSIVF